MESKPRPASQKFGQTSILNNIVSMKVDVELAGINQTKKKLRDGTIVTYYYAWKSGPRLEGEYGSPEFVTSYVEARKGRPVEPPKTLGDLLDDYASSKAFENKLAVGTKRKKLRYIRRIKRDAIAELTIPSLSNPRTTEILETWMENMAAKTPGEAQNQWATLSAGLSWAVDKRIIKSNPCDGVERLRSGSRVDKIWSEFQVEKFCKEAPSHLVIALMIALWTGQREGSLVKLRWSTYDGDRLCVEQEKNRQNQPPKLVVVPVMGAFKNFMDALERKAGVVGLSQEERHKRYILLNGHGRRWGSANSFCTTFSRAVQKIIVDRTFHDLRGTAVTRLARSGCTVPQIAAITGHSLKTVHEILDKHYLYRDVVLAEQAMKKRDEYESSQLPSQLLENLL